ncbi:hypothetical protein O181_032865 [Austropuccinia psidii MF-1]|uniref:Uncharacterized protein n=1 Tax=Austropuccinia psidii MF-1 TaxID=1389203 RepID=A0A9Q3H8M6_9BASI|nr:hypothetical protein [Austropuccinia psidii MF-1]
MFEQVESKIKLLLKLHHKNSTNQLEEELQSISTDNDVDGENGFLTINHENYLTPGRMLPQLLAIEFTSPHLGHVTSASRQRQLSHVSHEYVTQSQNPYQHHWQGLGNYTSWCKAAVWNEMTSTLPPGHLTPSPFLLLRMNWLLHPCLILSNP